MTNDSDVTPSEHGSSAALRAQGEVLYGGERMTSTSGPRHRLDVPEVTALGSIIDCDQPRGLSAADEPSSEGVE